MNHQSLSPATTQVEEVTPEVITEPASRRFRLPLDKNGREKRFVFDRRMNSAALALYADVLISLLASVSVAALVLVIFAFLDIITFADLQQLASDVLADPTSYELPDSLYLSSAVAAAIALPASHMIPAYMHSVRNKFGIMSTMKRGKKLGWTLPAAIVVAMGFTYAWIFIYDLCGRLMPDSFFADSNLFGSAYSGMDTASMIITAVTTGILVPIAEEFLFRGALLKSFSKYGVGFAVFASSLLFGLMHGNLIQTPFATVAGVIMAYVAVRSGSILPSIAIHMFVNSYSAVHEILLAVLPSDCTTIVEYAFYGFAALCIPAAIIILIAGRRRISWTPIDSESNNVLLPRVDSKVRCKVLRMVFSFGIFLFIAIFVFSILLSCGVDFGIEGLFIGC